MALDGSCLALRTLMISSNFIMGIFSLFALGMCFSIMLGEMVSVLWMEKTCLTEVGRKSAEVAYTSKSRTFRQ